MSLKLPKIFLDSGDPEESKKARGLLGFLDGQTTNPSLVVKNPHIQQYLSQGRKLTEEELLSEYKKIVGELGKIMAGPISVEVYADWDTPATTMLAQARDMFTWTKNAYVKFPTIPAGLEAAQQFVSEGGRVNMTLVFDQPQAAAVYSATVQTSAPAFVSPFIGRWDDRGYNGLDLVRNILKMYRKFDQTRHTKPHVEVLAASIRTLDHFYSSIVMGADILTVPMSIIRDWIHQDERFMPDKHYRSTTTGLKPLVYEELSFSPDFKTYGVKSEDGSLLNEGISKFVNDWKKLL